ncbi:hypothetical protein [Aeromonas veronii]|uniref:hypothetical protein n=1 Tax=Aeromonas veronii TaxID=654 RepID=UPI002B49C787|nr:hypothetical protein [Aeromonas veronii]
MKKITLWFKSKELRIAYVTENEDFNSFKDNKQKLIEFILDEKNHTHGDRPNSHFTDIDGVKGCRDIARANDFYFDYSHAKSKNEVKEILEGLGYMIIEGKKHIPK